MEWSDCCSYRCARVSNSAISSAFFLLGCVSRGGCLWFLLASVFFPLSSMVALPGVCVVAAEPDVSVPSVVDPVLAEPVFEATAAEPVEVVPEAVLPLGVVDSDPVVAADPLEAVAAEPVFERSVVPPCPVADDPS